MEAVGKESLAHIPLAVVGWLAAGKGVGEEEIACIRYARSV